MKLYQIVCENDTCYAGGTCAMTGDFYNTANFKKEDYIKWKEGALIQDAFPYLSVDDREYLITSLSPAAWKNLFQE